MEIVRSKSIAEAFGEPLIEIRDVGKGQFLLSICLNDDLSELTGPFPSAEFAEQEGVAR